MTPTSIIFALNYDTWFQLGTLNYLQLSQKIGSWYIDTKLETIVDTRSVDRSTPIVQKTRSTFASNYWRT
jgi:hypothetical protein